MLEEIKTLLGSSNGYTDAQIGICLKMALAEVEAYCNRELDYELQLCAERIAIIKLGLIGSEALDSESFSSITQDYINGYPDDILAILNRKRRIKVI